MHLASTSVQPVQLAGQTTKMAFSVISTMLIGTGSVYGVDRTADWRHYLQPRVQFILDEADDGLDGVGHPDIRTPIEHLENIRNVLNMPIAGLADILDVSRQAIYKWLSGKSEPEPEKLDRIVQLSSIADAFSEAGISHAGSLLKMKAFNGRSLMDLIKSGENSSDHVAALINEARAMEESYKQSGLLTSKSKPTDDWRSSISIPGSPEQS